MLKERHLSLTFVFGMDLDQVGLGWTGPAFRVCAKSAGPGAPINILDSTLSTVH